MKTLTFTFDGHYYHILNANDDQYAPAHGDTVRDDEGREVVYVTHDGEYWVAECCDSPGYSTVHENEHGAAWTAVRSAIASYY